jgi:uncharacterized phiE125 gp8 family phage protein
MMVTEETGVPDAALPVAQLRAHLRLGTGFGDDGLEDGLLALHLRAAMAAIEGRTGKALLARRFRLRLAQWRGGRAGQALPVAPVRAVLSVEVMGGPAPVAVPPARWRLVPDLSRPRLMAAGDWPSIPEGGAVEIVLDAGFGADWPEVPPDLAQAVLLLAAEFHEQRHEVGLPAAALPRRVQGLIERWRTVRILGGGGA